MKKEEIIITNSIKSQIKVILFPENKDRTSGEVDLIRLKLTNIESDKKIIDMTPDEALEISSLLTTAVQFYLYKGNEDYKELLKKRKKIVKKRNKN